ncbi:MAG: VCBS repeat-containing protein [Planctomycetota bacterium]
MRIETLERRRVLAAFITNPPISTNADGASSVQVADVDGDGDLDLLSASFDDDKIAWYENDGSENFTLQTISVSADGASDVQAADIDGDGDLDVVSASYRDHTIAWYENDGTQFFTLRTISDFAFGATSVRVADVDGDGDLDVLSASSLDSSIAWYENDGTQDFTSWTISSVAFRAKSVQAADVDGDGDLDVLGASDTFGEGIAWYENDGSESFTSQVITTSVDGAQSVLAADVDGDGDMDLLSASFDDDKIAWYENDGSQNFTLRTISTSADGASDVQAADVDGDGDLDVLSASVIDNKIAWYINDGSQNFAPSTISTSADGAQSVRAADIDGDGDLDVFSASFDDNKIAWYENSESDFGDAPSPYPTALSDDGASHDATGPTLGSTRDSELDGQADDGADEDGVTFGTIQVGALNSSVTVNVQGSSGFVDAWIDFNGDGSWGGQSEQIFDSVSVGVGDNVLSFDVPADALAGTTYARFRLSTSGGLGHGGSAVDGEVEDYAVMIVSPTPAGVGFVDQTISTSAAGASSVKAADIDGDGDMDLLSASQSDNKIAWYENDGSQSFTLRTISLSANDARSVRAADIDGDGDLDVLSASVGDDKIAWYENDGLQNFTLRTISTMADAAFDVQAADVDGDGDLDVLSASFADDKVAWYENDGSQGFSLRTISVSAFGAISVHVADVDGDGDLDVLSASYSDNKIAWYENDGSQSFTPRTISNSASGAYSVKAADVDGDGDLDVLSASRSDDTIAWYINDGSQNFTMRTISASATGARDVQAADVDGDGDLDVLSALYSGGAVAWYENDGSQNFTSRIITNFAFGARSVEVADVDGDGDLDVLSASIIDDTIAWYENVRLDFGDAPSPYPTSRDDDGARHVERVGPTLGSTWDFELDGQVDDGADEDGVTIGTIQVGALDASVTVNVQGASGLLDAWIDFNRDGSWGGQREQIFDSVNVGIGENVLTFDVPADALAGTTYARFRVSTSGGLGHGGAAADGEVEDYAVTMIPPAISGFAFVDRTISNSGDTFRNVQAADIDGDGDMDLVSASSSNDRIAWHENDGFQSYTLRTISTSADGAIDVQVADIDGDGDLDVISASYNDDKIAWYENDGLQNFTLRTIDSINSNGARQVQVADIDGDGDLDVLGRSSVFTSGDSQAALIWYQNDGSADFLNYFSFIGSSETGRWLDSELTDVDGDGDLDVLIIFRNNFAIDSTIGWYENNGSQSFTLRTISVAVADFVDATDIDGDGDLDVLSASAGDDAISWYENDGAQNFTTRTIDAPDVDTALDIRTADVDGDGDMDLLLASSGSSSRGVSWYENDGSATFTFRAIDATSAGATRPADVDGDGDLDVLVLTDVGNITWYQNSLVDFGDAPSPYPTTLADDGAQHADTDGPTLGTTRDFEPDGQVDDGSDEDGVLFGAIRANSGLAGVNIDLQNAPEAFVDAWIDFDADGVWDSDEQILDSRRVLPGLQTLNYVVPSDLVIGETYARVRLSSAGGLEPTGLADDGEVEDYLVTIVQDLSLDLAASGLINVTVTLNGPNVEIRDDDNAGTVVDSFALSNTQSLALVGGSADESVTVDYGNGFFSLPDGIAFDAGDGTDRLSIVGDGGTRAIYRSDQGSLGDASVTTRNGTATSVVEFSSIEPLDVTGMLTFSVDGDLNIGTEMLTIGSIVRANLGDLTTINGGAIVSNSGVSLGSGEALIGHGSIDASFAGDTGSTVILDGNLAIGDGNAVDGFITDGDVFVDEHTLTLRDSNQAVLGSLTNLGNATTPGIIQADRGVLVDFGRNITGYGAVDTPNDIALLSFINGQITGDDIARPITLDGYIKGVGGFDNVSTTGTYSPGFSPAQAVHGSVTYDSDLILELGGITPGSTGHDQLIHTGSVTLNGDLTVELINGFVPTGAELFELIIADGGVQGEFDSVTLPTLPSGNLLDLQIDAGVVQIAEAESGQVEGRHIFYNRSFFDGGGSGVDGSNDQAAIANKVALLPGNTASSANYTNFSRGINGIIVDLSNSDGVTLDDFEFRIGNSAVDPSMWSFAPTPTMLPPELGGGTNGSDRFTFVWDDNAIQNQWLRVVVRANERTNLVESDIQYWGNAIGDTFGSTANAQVNATDQIAIRSNPRNFLNPAAVDDVFDINKDRLVNATDELAARSNPTNFLTALKLLSV